MGTYQWGGYDAVDGLRTGERDESTCHFTHETNCTAAVHEINVGFVHGFGKGTSGFHVSYGSQIISLVFASKGTGAYQEIFQERHRRRHISLLLWGLAESWG